MSKKSDEDEVDGLDKSFQKQKEKQKWILCIVIASFSASIIIAGVVYVYMSLDPYASTFYFLLSLSLFIPLVGSLELLTKYYEKLGIRRGMYSPPIAFSIFLYVFLLLIGPPSLQYFGFVSIFLLSIIAILLILYLLPRIRHRVSKYLP